METLLPYPQFVTSSTDATTSIERAVLASIADGVVVNDVAGNVILINQAACRLLRVDPAAVIERPVRDLFASFSARARLALIDALERLDHDPYSYGPGEGITETVIELGALVIQAHLSPVLTEIGEFSGIVTILRDITREVEAEHAKSDFVSNVSHELRTPLTSIVGYTNLLLGHAVGPISDPSQLPGRHSNQCQSAGRVDQRLLDISRIESGRLDLDIRPVSLAEVLHEVSEMIRPQCDQKNLRLTIEIEPDIDRVLGDRNRLVQIVANLASNAYRYTPSGGSITLSLARSDTTARVSVADNGIGISLEDQAKIFQRFYRVSNAAIFEAAGTGLGLPITKMLVEMHGGRLWVNSEPDKGSTFTFVLPLQIAEPASGRTPPPAEPQAVNKTILVVENDSDLARQIGRQLRLEGVNVLTTAWGEEALQWVHQRAIDLITLDMALPDVPGMEVLRRLKADKTTSNIPVVIVSIIREQNGEDWGAAERVTRPFAVEKLIASIRQTLSLQQANLPA
jgi:PAS domain S-box-containing protein